MGDWWRREVDQDRAYRDVVTPLLMEVLRPRRGSTYLDLGCGEGRVMRDVERAGGVAFGIDINSDLVVDLSRVVVARLPVLPFQVGSFDGVYCVLTLEHIEDHHTLFAEAVRVVRAGGAMALVMNHPMWTAPGSTPITDEDGEILWRPGDYFEADVTSLAAGGTEVAFYHRPLSELIDAAAGCGWNLERLVEQPHHDLTDQSGIPRLLACRWRAPQT